MNNLTIESTEQGEVGIEIFQRLSNEGILFIFGEITSDMAADICATLLLKDSEDLEKITLLINSDGGEIRNSLAIYDVMCSLSTPIETVCIGTAMKEAAILLAAGTPGMRYATKHSVIGMGQLVNIWAQPADSTDVKVLLNQSLNDNKRMMEIVAKHTNKPFKQVVKDFERIVFMDVRQAKSYGFFDKMVLFNNGTKKKSKKEQAAEGEE
jgi:ATP-dependent Clp protease, protease subunit